MKNEQDDSGLPSLFGDDATVVDGGEGKTMHGRDEIRPWVTNAYLDLQCARISTAWATRDVDDRATVIEDGLSLGAIELGWLVIAGSIAVGRLV
jgi:hypothetical protein